MQSDYERGALEALAAGSIIDGYTTIIIEEKLDTICRMCRIWGLYHCHSYQNVTNIIP